MSMNRRQFLQFLGIGTVGLSLFGVGTGAMAGLTSNASLATTGNPTDRNVSRWRAGLLAVNSDGPKVSTWGARLGRGYSA